MHAVNEQTSCRMNLMGRCPDIGKTDVSEDRKKINLKNETKTKNALKTRYSCSYRKME